MKIALRLIVIAVLFAACIGSESLSAAFEVPANEGWHSWQIEDAASEDLKFYVLVRSGKPARFHVRNSRCDQRALPDATDLGFVTADESIAWLQRYIQPRSELSSGAIMLISLHPGNRPVEILASVLTSKADRKIREEALFWLAQSDSEEAFDVLDRLLSGPM